MKRVYVVVTENGEIEGVWTKREDAEEYVAGWQSTLRDTRFYIEEYPLNEA